MLKIEYLSISDIKPYENNAKIHTAEQIEQIKTSIRQFGFNDPIALWHDNEIIEGHGRLIAAQELGMDKLPVIRLDSLSDDERRAYMLVHNKLTMDTGFDEGLLDIELGNIDIDMEQFGFDIDIDTIVYDPESIEDDDFTEEVETKCSQGDLWQLDNHRLICGDSTDERVLSRLMGGQRADMVFTDPPWNVNYGGTNHPSWKRRTILNDYMPTEDFKRFMTSAFVCMNESSKEGAMTYVVMSAQEWGNLMLALADNDYHWSSTIIWVKDAHVLSRKDYHTQYEPIWYGWKGGTRVHPLTDRTQSDVWEIPRPIRSDEHPTMKPVSLVARAIHNSSDNGDIVLDLFGGSGTTLIAAEELGRSCYMVELDPHYCDVIINRWEQLTGKQAELVR